MTSPLDSAFQALPPSVPELFMVLGACPLEWFDPHTAAVVLNIEHDDAREHCDVLARAGLLEEHEPGFTFSDAQSAYAMGLAYERVGEPALLTGLDRLTDHFLLAATTAEKALTPSHATFPRYYRTNGPRTVPFTMAEPTMLDWLASQLPNYMALLRNAHMDGHNRLAWQLADALWPLWLRRRHAEQRYEAQLIGLAAARADQHAEAEGRMLTGLAGTVMNIGRLWEAEAYDRCAEALYIRIGNPLGLAQALNGRGMRLLQADALDEAESLFRQAMALRAAHGYRRGAALSRQGLGRVELARGNARAAREHLLAAYDALMQEGDVHDAALTRAWCAQAAAADASWVQATSDLNQAQAAIDAVCSPYAQAAVLELSGLVHQNFDEISAARDCYTQALQLFTGLDEAGRARTAARLDALASA